MTSKEMHQVIGAILVLVAATCGISAGFIMFGIGPGLFTVACVFFFIGLMYINSAGS